jgi:hypothetical protein
MKKHYFFIITLILQSLCVSFAQCPAGSSIWNGTENNLNISGNYCFTSGTFTGNISNISSSATIYVSAGASFKPSNINDGLKGTLNIYGEAVLPNVSLKVNFKLFNYGKTTFNSGVTFDGSNVQITNSNELTFNGNPNFNGANCKVITVTGGSSFINLSNNSNLILSNSVTFDNSGLLKVTGGDFNFNDAASTFYNRAGGVARIGKNFNPKGNFINDGLVVVSGFSNINSTTNLINNCRFVIVGGMDNNSFFTNNGLLWSPNGKIQNNGNGKFELGSKSVTRGKNFGNDGIVYGSGKMYFTDTTTHQGSATFNGNSSASPITFYDASQTNSQIFDVQTAPFSNTVRADFTPADTNTFDCSSAILPLTLINFDARATSKREVLLTWQTSAESNLKNFVIERNDKANSSNWQMVGTVPASGNTTSIRNYQMTDKHPLNSISYYRLRSVDYDNKQTISALRQVDLKSAGTISVYPNLVQKGGIVKVLSDQPLRYQISDVSGKKVGAGTFSAGASVLSINLNAGIYLIEVLLPNQSKQYTKIVVQ